MALSIRSDDVTRLWNDLVNLNIVARVKEGDFVPYHAMARGIVALDYHVEQQMD